MPTEFPANPNDFTLPPSAIEILRRHAGASSVNVDLSARSHQGLIRDRNEDSYLVLRGFRGLEVLGSSMAESAMPPRFEFSSFGMLVADGMGGMPGGDVASRVAVQTLIALVLNTPDWIMLTGEAENEELLTRLAERYRKVDSALREEGMVDPKLSGLGTTMTVAYSLGADIFLAHVGDSRAYLLRGDGLHRLTKDHTYAQILADLGAIPAQEVVRHQFRHVLTRYLGAPKPVNADVHQMRLHDGDQILLCTDGLTSLVDDPAIAAILRGAQTAAKACEDLVLAALNQGGMDNVTVALARYRFQS
ncbi:MAG TPA: protein phosphatase 2C domain-containing protein [Gemmataceae bacterium]|nr:protein phosphatase 2C domain-containing protein [Gemmataceae bacterium]